MRYFYLALNESRQNKADYLVWVETDNEGTILGPRIHDQLIEGSWGEIYKSEYENRLQDDEDFLRPSDSMKIKLVAKFENGDVRLSFEDIAGEIYEKEFTPHMPPFLRAFFNNAFTYVVKWNNTM